MDNNHPIESLMKTTMENLKEMIDVNKIVGDAVETPDGDIIIPISRLTFGFVAGGSDFGSETKEEQQNKIRIRGGENFLLAAEVAEV